MAGVDNGINADGHHLYIVRLGFVGEMANGTGGDLAATP